MGAGYPENPGEAEHVPQGALHRVLAGSHWCGGGWCGGRRMIVLDCGGWCRGDVLGYSVGGDCVGCVGEGDGVGGMPGGIMM